MYALWCILAISVLCESVAQKWQVWVSLRISTLRSSADISKFVGKLFAGIGVGSLQFITPTYVSEIAPTRIRGLLLILYNFW
jgi:SP family general alpha glucoside:H+ symporter-like MFS transporter